MRSILVLTWDKTDKTIYRLVPIGLFNYVSLYTLFKFI